MADKSEIIMMITPRSGSALDAECSLQMNPPDDLMEGFTEGEFFQIEDFSFGLGLSDNDKNKSGAGAPKGGAGTLDFSKWRNQLSSAGSTKYNLNVEPVSFSRVMDRASPALFQACCQSQTMKSATIVSRKRVGSDAGPKGYLRMDFTDVLIIDIDWEEGEQIKEKYKFICRGMKMQYKPQTSDGALGVAVPGVWPKSK